MSHNTLLFETMPFQCAQSDEPNYSGEHALYTPNIATVGTSEQLTSGICDPATYLEFARNAARALPKDELRRVLDTSNPRYYATILTERVIEHRQPEFYETCHAQLAIEERLGNNPDTRKVMSDAAKSMFLGLFGSIALLSTSPQFGAYNGKRRSIGTVADLVIRSPGTVHRVGDALMTDFLLYAKLCQEYRTNAIHAQTIKQKCGNMIARPLIFMGFRDIQRAFEARKNQNPERILPRQDAWRLIKELHTDPRSFVDAHNAKPMKPQL